MYIADKNYTYNGLGSTYNAKHLYYDYITNTYKNPSAYMNETAVAWGYPGEPLYVYQILNTLDWLIQDYVLGGLTKSYLATDLVGGFSNELITNLTISSNNNYETEAWKKGDSIKYVIPVTPFIHGNMWSGASSNPYIKVNTGYPLSFNAGKIVSMNDQNYPNLPFAVYDGQGSTTLEPFRCSEANFTETNVYTWQQNRPQNNDGTEIVTMNMMNMQLQHQVLIAEDYICVNGTGNQSCDFDFNARYNSFKQMTFTRNTSFTAINNCGSRIFSHGYGSQTTNVDQYSGLSTSYVASQDSTFSWTTLTAPNPNNPDELIHTHPFPALRLLKDMMDEMVGATLDINLGGTRSQFNVTTD